MHVSQKVVCVCMGSFYLGHRFYIQQVQAKLPGKQNQGNRTRETEPGKQKLGNRPDPPNGGGKEKKKMKKFDIVSSLSY